MPFVPQRLLTHLACVLLALLVAGCERKPAERSPLSVFAAASLREPFEALARELEREHPGTEVRLNLAGSQQLAAQLEHGATPDLFASADPEVLERLARAGLVAAPQVFAENELVIVVPKGNPERIAGLEDLPRVDRLVLAGPEVPIGRYSRELLSRAEARLGPGFRAGIEAKVRSGELSTRQVLARVALGEADAGIVYRTDVAAAKEVEAVELPRDLNVRAAYAIATVSNPPHPELATAFVTLVLSPRGRDVLRRHGFRVRNEERAP